MSDEAAKVALDALTKAGQVLAVGTGESQLHAAAEHIAVALDAESVSLLALLSGCLFTAAMTAPVEGDARQARSARLAALAGTAGVYAIYGWALSAQATALEQPWYLAVGQPWGVTAAFSAEMGGRVMWVLSAATLAVIAGMITSRGAAGDRVETPAGKPVPERASP